MKFRRLLLVAIIGIAMLLGSGCYVRVIGPPLLIPVPVPLGEGYYGRPYYGHGYYR
jgi:hypothetical protein